MAQDNFPKKGNIIHFIAIGFGTGLINFASGTWGSLLAFLIFILLELFFDSTSILFSFVFLSIILCLISCIVASSDSPKDDDSRIVADEIAGMLLTLMAIYFVSNSIFSYLAGFFLFRLFDIIKPWPVSYVDKNIKNGYGVFFDDILAGIISIIFFYILFFLLFA